MKRLAQVLHVLSIEGFKKRIIELDKLLIKSEKIDKTVKKDQIQGQDSNQIELNNDEVKEE
jgi:hypothetical protein